MNECNATVSLLKHLVSPEPTEEGRSGFYSDLNPPNSHGQTRGCLTDPPTQTHAGSV